VSGDNNLTVASGDNNLTVASGDRRWRNLGDS
jgi:hypothetical protein